MRKYIVILILLITPNLLGQCNATDSFPGTILSSTNWTQATGTTVAGGTVTPFKVVSGIVSPSTSGTQSMANWIGPTCTPPPNQCTSMVVSGTITGDSGPMVRANAAAQTGYLFQLFPGSDGASGTAISRMAGMRGQDQAVGRCPIIPAGHTAMICVRGTTLYGYDNGVLKCQGGNGVLTSGAPGMMVSTNSGTTDSLSTFSATTAQPVAPIFAPYQSGRYRFHPIETLTSPDGYPICYTTDGTTPTAPTAGTCSGGTTQTYSGPITVAATETITAMVTSAGLTNSPTTSVTLTILTGAAQTVYVRPDGGQRFSINVGFGQCDGLADVGYVTATGALSNKVWWPSTSYPSGTVILDTGGFYETSSGGTSGSNPLGPSWGGSTTGDNTITWTKGASYPKNGHCAFNQIWYLMQDGSNTSGPGDNFPAWGWLAAGGDNNIVRGCANANPSDTTCRIGWPTGSGACAANGCAGIPGQNSASGLSTPPSGGPSNHTILQSSNSGACTSLSARQIIHGGWGVQNVMSLYGGSYIDVSCFRVTDYSACGVPGQPISCSGQDYANNGMQTSNTSTHDTLTDFQADGLAASGMVGPTGDQFIINDLQIEGNALAGWSTDAGDGTTGTGVLSVTNFDISWNGCAEEYPIVDSLPYTGCTGQTSGGYGDGFGTATVTSYPGWNVSFNIGTVAYNTQDGLDSLHIGGPGSTITTTRVLAFSNMGQQLKGGGATSTLQNNLIVANCEAMSNAIPGTPSGYNSQLIANPGDFCRAGNSAVVMNLTAGDQATFQNNTVFSGGNIFVEAEYNNADVTNPAYTALINNNTFVGFFNSGHGANPTPWYNQANLNFLTNPGSSFTNNSTFGQNTGWPCPFPGETAALCTTPQLTDMTFHTYGYGNMAPASSTSAVVGAGVHLAAITVDYNGTARPNPPAIGALEFTTGPPTVNTPTCTPGPGTYTSTQTVSCSSATTGAVICGTTDGSTPTATTPGACTHGTSGPFTISVTSTINVIGTLTGEINSPVGSYNYVISTPPPPSTCINLVINGVTITGVIIKGCTP